MSKTMPRGGGEDHAKPFIASASPPPAELPAMAEISRELRVACFRISGGAEGRAGAYHAWLMTAACPDAARERLRILEPIAREYGRREDARANIDRAKAALKWLDCA